MPRQNLSETFRQKIFLYLLKVSPVLISIFLVTGFVYAVWNAPTASPPDGNTAPPINTSSIEQTKAGNLILNNGTSDSPQLIFNPGPDRYSYWDNYYGTTRLVVQDATGESVKMVIGNDGNVGIGTIAPHDQLHVKETGSSTDTEIVIEYGGSGGGVAREYSVGVYKDGFFSIRDRTVDAHRFVITNDGNVGIGTTNPGYPLTVKTDAIHAIAINSTVPNQELSILFQELGTSKWEISKRGDDRFAIWNSDKKDVFSITWEGRVGIRTMRPDGLVHIEQPAPIGNLLILDADDGGPWALRFENKTAQGNGYGDFAFYVDNNGRLHLGEPGANPNYWVVNNDGNVGIGTTRPTQLLDVNGKIRMRNQTTDTDSADTVATKGYVDSKVGSGGSGVFGTRQTIYRGHVYTASTDGFVVVMTELQPNNVPNSGVKVIVNGIVRGKVGVTGSNVYVKDTMTIPIKKGESYSITGGFAVGDIIEAYWMPLQ